jgi:hypothetical protein
MDGQGQPTGKIMVMPLIMLEDDYQELAVEAHKMGVTVPQLMSMAARHLLEQMAQKRGVKHGIS